MSRPHNERINPSFNSTLSCYVLSAINASGTTDAALYNAVLNNVLYTEPSLVPLTLDKSTTAPYLHVELEALQDLEVDERMLLMVDHLLKTLKANVTTITPFDHDDIKQVWVVSHLFENNVQSNKNSVRAWQQHVQSKIEECFQQNKITIRFVSKRSFNDIFTLTEPVLLVMVDSFHSPECVTQLKSAHKIQVVKGKTGLIVGEGAICTLLAPQPLAASTSPSVSANERALDIESFNPEQKLSLNAQLKQAKVGFNDVIVQVGVHDETWVKHWYQQSHYLVETNKAAQTNNNLVSEPEQPDFLSLYTPNTVVGYTGAADFFTGVYFAQAWLHFPLHQHTESTASIYVVEHSINQQHDITASLYRVSLSANN